MYKDVTPRSFDLIQHKRAQSQPTDMQRAFQRANQKSETERLQAEIDRIKRKITTLCEADASPDVIIRWKESKAYNEKLLAQQTQVAA